MKDALRAAFFIALKDMKTYYFKPPNISWGILFPLVFILAFYLRSSGDFSPLVPGLLALSLLFGTTSMEAIVITFERMTGAMERLMLYPVSTLTILTGKVAGGAFVSVSVKQVFEAQTLANLFRFPMIFLSGVFIPVSALPPALKPVAYAMPLTYSIDCFKAAFGHQPEIMHPAASLAVLLLFTVTFLALSVRIMKSRT